MSDAITKALNKFSHWEHSNDLHTGSIKYLQSLNFNLISDLDQLGNKFNSYDVIKLYCFQPSEEGVLPCWEPVSYRIASPVSH